MPFTDPKKRSAYNRRHYLKKKASKKGAGTVGDERKVPHYGRYRETLLARVQRITMEGISTGRFPWKTTNETIEALIVRGLQSLKGDPIIDEMLPHLEIAQHLDRIQALRREAMNILNKARTEISELKGMGAHDGAVTYYHMTMEAARKLPPTEWRDWLLRELKNSFPSFAKEKPKPVYLMGKPKKSKRRAFSFD